jgi:GWxTD domain-containing protein
MRAPLRALAALLIFSTTVACAGRRPAEPREQTAPRRGPAVGSLQIGSVYRQSAMLVSPEPIPFVGSVRYLAGSTADSTLVMVTISFANQGLTFVSEAGGVRRAGYAVTTQLRREGGTVVRATSAETVRVATVRESARSDESVVFQQFFHAPPGDYTISVALRDEGSARLSAAELPVSVPAFRGTGLSVPIAIYEGEARATRDLPPQIVSNPRATAVIGRDRVLPVYLEAYGLDSAARVEIRALDDRSRLLWGDTLAFALQEGLGTARVEVPVAVVGVGRHTVVATLVGSDGVRTSAPVFVSFGEGVAIGSFDEMLNYLRHFTAPERLQPLRDTVPERRAEAWATFLRETDPDPRTPEHEGLRAYFNRIHMANERFREDVPAGWQGDRGRVYVTFGEPDQVLQSINTAGAAVGRRGRSQMWTYSRLDLQLIFVDQTGLGRWELTPSSEFDLQAAIRRERTRQTEMRPLGEG